MAALHAMMVGGLGTYPQSGSITTGTNSITRFKSLLPSFLLLSSLTTIRPSTSVTFNLIFVLMSLSLFLCAVCTQTQGFVSAEGAEGRMDGEGGGGWAVARQVAY